MTGGLQIQDLWFAYGSVPVLKGIELMIPKGELCAVVGQSGAGKSTLIKCLLQAEWPRTGTVTYDVDEVSYVSATRNGPDLSIIRRIGYVPQSTLLFPHLTALKNITLSLTEVHRQSTSLARVNALAALATVGIAELADFYPWRLSGGQQQRVAIARSLAVRPLIFLLDEPTAAIDGQNLQVIARALRDDVVNRDACALIVTHNLAFAKRYCDSIALLVDGAIRWHLRTNEVRVEQALMELG
jgi:cystine transport system ATP-binding protein